MTITLSIWAIPIVLSILTFVFAKLKYKNDTRHGSSGWLDLSFIDAIFYSVLTIVGILFIWLVFFAVMYFTK